MTTTVGVIKSVPSVGDCVRLTQRCHRQPVGLHEEALAEAQAAFDWYAARNPAGAEGFMNELDQAIEQIGRLPSLAGPYVSGTRRYVMRRFPFTVVYREQEAIIEVIEIAHGRRKPAYWKERIKS